jgi:hypothetical protein
MPSLGKRPNASMPTKPGTVEMIMKITKTLTVRINEY